MNSGDKESAMELTIESKIKEYEKQLDDIIEKVGVSYVKDEESIKSLELSYQQLRQMDQQECSILAYKLMQYSLYIQGVYNRLSNISHYCEQHLNKIIGKYAKNYGTTYTKYEEKRAAIIAENSAADALSKILLKSSGKARELYNISNKINTMSNILIELSKSKRHLNG